MSAAFAAFSPGSPHLHSAGPVCSPSFHVAPCKRAGSQQCCSRQSAQRATREGYRLHAANWEPTLSKGTAERTGSHLGSTASNGSGTRQRSVQDEAVARQVIDQTAKIVGEMLKQIHIDLTLSETYSKLTESMSKQHITKGKELQSMAKEAQIIAQVVSERINELDHGFLPGLEAFSKAVRKSGQDELAEKLDMIRAEVLAQLADRLPPEVRVLNTVTQLMDRNDRRGVIREAAQGGHGKLPGISLPGLWLTANQVITDMEEAEVVPDRQLLAMVCLVREEIQYVAQELGRADGDLSSAVKAHRNLLPPAPLAFLQRLMQVSDPLQRQGLLSRVLREQAMEKDVKPGQLLTCISAMHHELSNTDTERADPQRVALLEDMQQEAMQALVDIVEKG